MKVITVKVRHKVYKNIEMKDTFPYGLYDEKDALKELLGTDTLVGAEQQFDIEYKVKEVIPVERHSSMRGH